MVLRSHNDLIISRASAGPPRLASFVLKAYGHELSLASKAAKELFWHSTMITSLFAYSVFYCLRFSCLSVIKT